MSEEQMSGGALEQTPEQIAAVEEQARAQGWSADKYPKDHPKYKTAQEYIDFGESLGPILRANNKRLVEQNTKLEQRITEIQEAVKKFAEIHEQTKKQAYTEALVSLKAQKVAALEQADYNAVAEIDEQIADTKLAQKQPEVKVPEVTPQQTTAEKEYREWEVENEWVKDSELGARAMAEAQFLRAKGDQRMGRDFFNAVGEAVKKLYPDKFGKKQSVSMVEGGASQNTPVRGKKTFEALPKEAKEAYELLLTVTPKLTKEMYATEYYNRYGK